MSDTMKIEILADGTIKTTTDPISGPNHQSAERFLKGMADLAGGETTREKRTDVHRHHHHHHGELEHTHEHGEHEHEH